jgi:hypothetical protein
MFIRAPPTKGGMEQSEQLNPFSEPFSQSRGTRSRRRAGSLPLTLFLDPNLASAGGSKFEICLNPRVSCGRDGRDYVCARNIDLLIFCSLVGVPIGCYSRLMITMPARFRKRDLQRALKAVSDAGLVVERVELDPAGKASIIMATAGQSGPAESELDLWLASHAALPS